MEVNRLFSMIIGGTIGPVVILVTAIIMIWYAGAVYLNSSFLIDRYEKNNICLLYTSPSPRDVEESRMPSSA